MNAHLPAVRGSVRHAPWRGSRAPLAGSAASGLLKKNGGLERLSQRILSPTPPAKRVPRFPRGACRGDVLRGDGAPRRYDDAQRRSTLNDVQHTHAALRRSIAHRSWGLRGASALGPHTARAFSKCFVLVSAASRFALLAASRKCFALLAASCSRASLSEKQQEAQST